MTTTIVPAERAAQAAEFFTPEQVQLIKRTFLRPKDREATDDELALFVYQCERANLDPFVRQIYAVYRWDSRARMERMQVETTIDGFRLVAERTGKYDGQTGELWCGEDAKWLDVWLDTTQPPKAAKIGVWKSGAREPTFAVATFAEYAQRNSSGTLIGLWKSMPANQLSKCAEAKALRKAFPRELSGLYTREEMAQADNPPGDAAELVAVRNESPTPSEDVAPPRARQTGPTIGGEDAAMYDEPARVIGREDVSAVARASAPETRGEDGPATPQEIAALRELIEVTNTAEGFVRMALIDYGIDDVGEIDELLPRLTVGQAAHVMVRINERASSS